MDLFCGLHRNQAKMGNKNTTFPSASTVDAESPLVVTSIRDEKPLHYTLKIQSFSLLKEAIACSKCDRFESQIFHASGYKWKLALYPCGNVERNGSDHISLYLVFAEDDISTALEGVRVVFTFLIHDNLRDKYLVIQDGKVRRFHSMKREWGFEKLIPLEYFNDGSNGLLVGDCCAFGVDIFVKKCDGGEGEIFSFIKQPKNNKYTWKTNYKQVLHTDHNQSDPFTMNNYNWKISLYPSKQGSHLSLYLIFDSSREIPRGSEVYVECEMAVLFCSASGEPCCKRKRTYKCWCGGERKTSCGSSDFMPLSDLEVLKRTRLYSDSVTVEVKINVISTFEHFLEEGNDAARS